MAVIGSSPFGSRTRTRALVALRLLGETYPRQLARLLEAPLSSVQKALAGLERDGVVAGRTVGRLRLYGLSPRYFARNELSRYLDRLTEAERELVERLAGLRRRPRRTGKRL